MALFPYLVTSTQTITSTLSTKNGLQSATNIAWTVNDGFRQLVTPIAMELSDLYVQLGVAPGSGTSRTFTIRKGTTNQSTTTTISDTATVNSDTTNTTSLSAGDITDIINTWTSTPADSTGSNQWSIMSSCANQVLFATGGATVSATMYIGIQATSTQTATLTDNEQVMPTSGTIRNLIARLGTTITSGSYVVTLYKNGSPTSLTCTLDSSNQQNTDSSNSVTVSAGDLLAWEMAYNTPSANRTVAISCEFVPDTPNEGILLATTGATAVQHSSKNYSGFYTCSNQFGSSATGKRAYALPMTIKKLYVALSNAPGSTYTRTIALDNNGTDDMSVTIANPNTSGSATGNVKIDLGDPICFSSLASSGSVTNSTIKVGLVFDATPSDGMFLMF